MNIQLVSFTKQGGRLCARLQEKLNSQEHYALGHCKYNIDGIKPLKGSIKDFIGTAFEACDAIIFIGAAGIAVRAIAAFVKSKATDPAVLVIDDTARYVIPILSGHMGGANELAHTIADILCALPIITTSTDCNYKFAVDTWAVNNDLHIANVENIKHISAALLNGEPVGLYSDYPIDGDLPEGLCVMDNTRVGISISLENKHCFKHTLQLIPKQYVLGIGCRKDTKYEDLLELVNSVLLEYSISQKEIMAIASIDLKAKEQALLKLCKEMRVPFRTYSAQELSSVAGEFTESSFVKETTGVDNVCERAAIRACDGELLMKKTCRAGITLSIAKREWRCCF